MLDKNRADLRVVCGRQLCILLFLSARDLWLVLSNVADYGAVVCSSFVNCV